MNLWQLTLELGSNTHLDLRDYIMLNNPSTDDEVQIAQLY